VLGKRAKCSASLIGQIEHGYRCGDEVAGRIARVLGCGPTELFEQVRVEIVEASR
jgi:hypothetical protein